jgi:hypothetical protein
MGRVSERQAEIGLQTADFRLQRSTKTDARSVSDVLSETAASLY